MNSAVFKTTEDRGISTVRLSRPDAGNRLLTAEIRDLGSLIRRLGEQPNTKMVVIRADGAAFCLGRQPDPGERDTKSAVEIRDGITAPILDLYAEVRATAVPVLAVIQGEARGFGCALVGQCDLAIAAASAEFSLPEMENDLPPTLAMSALLGKMFPKHLLQMVYSRRKISAHDALAMGLLSLVVPAVDLETAVEQAMADVSDKSRSALCTIKEYMTLAPHLDHQTASRLAANMMAVALSSRNGG